MTHPLHPIIVHFPIALLSTAMFFEVLERAMKRDVLREAATWLLGLGFLGALAATASGILAEEAAEEAGVPERAIETHELFAFATLAVFATLLAIRWLQKKRRLPEFPGVFLAIGLVGVALIGLTGYFGGDLVYRYGAGVERPAPTSAAPADHENP
ncbi:MAG: DUF2231 domain-containing protein [Nitrospirota bacterium]